MLAVLLMEQEYIEGVEIVQGTEAVKADVDLDRFRKHLVRTETLAKNHLDAFGLPAEEQDKAWLKVEPDTRFAENVIFNRSARCRNDDFPWKKLWEKFRDRILFIGLEEEFNDFASAFDIVGRIKRHRVNDFLEMAQIIAGCKLFVGNQSFPYAIAEGLKHNAILSVYPSVPNCMFERPNLINNLKPEDIDGLLP